jgi:gluconolactonase
MMVEASMRRIVGGALLGSACLAMLHAQVPPPPEGAPTTPALERLLDDGEVKALASGFVYADGAAWRRDGSLLFCDSGRNRLQRWEPKAGKAALIREPSGRPSAVAFDRDGNLLVAEQETRRISRTDRQAVVTTVVDRFEGKRLNSPNGLAVTPDGSIYFTDPPYGLPRQTEGKELDFQGVYRVNPDGSVVLLVRDLARPNGIAVAPDLKTLYVTDSETSELFAFTLAADGTAGTRRVLATLSPWKPGVVGAADGITLDETGRVYVAGPGGIWVFAQNGGRLGVIATPEPPSGCAFGGPGGTTLYITARTRLYAMRMKVRGLWTPATAR